MPATLAYRRAVLGMQRRTVDPATMSVIGEFAGLLRLELHGLFLADESILGLAEMPFVREFHRLSGGWQPLDATRLAAEFDATAREAERMFGEWQRRLSVGCTFEIVRGGAVHAMAGMSAHDIMIVPEPANPVERVVQPFARLVAAAFSSRAAVLLLPPRVERRTGSILVLAGSPDDSALATAFSIAAASGEQVVVAAPREIAEDPAVAAQARGAGVSMMPLSLPNLALPVRALARHLDPAREHLIVVTRGTLGSGRNDDLPALAEERRVPVLVVEPVEHEDQGKAA